MWYWHDTLGGWGVIWMALTMTLVWLPLIVLVTWGLRLGVGRRHSEEGAPPRAGPVPDAREIARQTYARGEIDRERYLQIIEDLDRTG